MELSIRDNESLISAQIWRSRPLRSGFGCFSRRPEYFENISVSSFVEARFRKKLVDGISLSAGVAPRKSHAASNAHRDLLGVDLRTFRFQRWRTGTTCTADIKSEATVNQQRNSFHAI
jgi:hypothetical protein